MTGERYKFLFQNIKEKVTPEENAMGWHFCDEFDGLLVGPQTHEWKYCTCWPRILRLQCERKFVESGGVMAEPEVPCFPELAFLDGEQDL